MGLTDAFRSMLPSSYAFSELSAKDLHHKNWTKPVKTLRFIVADPALTDSLKACRGYPALLLDALRRDEHELVKHMSKDGDGSIFDFVMNAAVLDASASATPSPLTVVRSTYETQLESLCRIFSSSQFSIAPYAHHVRLWCLVDWFPVDTIVSMAKAHHDKFPAIVDECSRCASNNHRKADDVLGKLLCPQSEAEANNLLPYLARTASLPSVQRNFVSVLKRLPLERSLVWIQQLPTSARDPFFHALVVSAGATTSVDDVCMWLRFTGGKVYPLAWQTTVKKAQQLVSDPNAFTLAELEDSTTGANSANVFALCAALQGIETFVLDTESVAALKQELHAATTYHDLLSSFCGTLTGKWWRDEYALLTDRFKGRTIAALLGLHRRDRLGKFVTWVKDTNSSERDAVEGILRNAKYCKVMVDKGVITSAALQDVPSLARRFHQYVEESIGENATIASALDFYKATGMSGKVSYRVLEHYSGFFEGCPEEWKQQHGIDQQFIKAPIQATREVLEKFACEEDGDPFTKLFWWRQNAPSQYLLRDFHAHHSHNDYAAVLTTSLQQMAFLHKVCSARAEPVRSFIVKQGKDLLVLPDLICRRDLKLNWAAMKLISLRDQCRPLLDGRRPVKEVHRASKTATLNDAKFIDALLADDVLLKLEQAVESIERGDVKSLQDTINVVLRERLSIKLVYDEGKSVADMVQGSYEFVDGSRVVSFSEIERCYRSCCIMSPQSRKELKAERFLLIVTTVRYAVHTFAELLQNQRQSALFEEDGNVCGGFQVYSRMIQVNPQAQFSIKGLIGTIRSVESRLKLATRCLMEKRLEHPVLAYFSDSELEYFFQKKLDESARPLLALRLGVSQNTLKSLHGRGIKTYDDLGRTLAAVRADEPRPSNEKLLSLHVPAATSSNTHDWTLELLHLYMVARERLPEFSEVLILSEAMTPATAAERIKFFVMKSCLVGGSPLFSIVLAALPSNAVHVWTTLAAVLRETRAEHTQRHPVHIFLADGMMTMQESIRLSLSREHKDLVIDHRCSGKLREGDVAPLRELFKSATLYYSDAPRSGKSTAVRAAGPTGHIMLLDGSSDVAVQRELSNAVKRENAVVWLELGCCVSHSVASHFFSLVVLGGMHASARQAVVVQDVRFLVEAAPGILAELPILHALPRVGYPQRPEAVVEFPSTILEDVLPTLSDEAKHGVVAFFQWASSKATHTAALNNVILRTGAWMCTADTHPQIDILGWSQRDNFEPSRCPYMIAWDAEDKPLIVINGNADQVELAELPPEIEKVNVGPGGISDDDLRSLFVRAVGAPTDAIDCLGGYVVTRHTLMAAIRIRLCTASRCCPCITVGETGCGKTHLVNVLKDCWKRNVVTIEVNPGTVWSDPDNPDAVETILKAQDRSKETILFFDELNTWAKQDIVKALMIDGTYCGFTIPPQWCVVGACNPLRFVADVDNADSLVYSVQRHTHPSVGCFVWSFGNSEEDEEKKIVRLMCEASNRRMDATETDEFEPLSDAAVEYFVSNVPAAHKFVREHTPERIVSFRDTARCIRLSYEIKPSLVHMAAVVDDLDYARIAFAMTYLVSIDARRPQRAQFVALFPGLEDVLLRIGKTVCDILLAHRSVVRHSALEETVLVVFLCIFTRTPLIIVGPPGTSKSFASYLVTDALKSDVARNLQSVIAFNFQCSSHTRPSALSSAFSTAFNGDKNNAFRTVAAMLVDELGLAEAGADKPLKVLNKWLDREGVFIEKEMFPSFVGTSNIAVDRSIMNRTIALFRALPTQEELCSMLVATGNEGITQYAADVAGLVLETSKTLHTAGVGIDQCVFGMRDFYSLNHEIQWGDGKHDVRRCIVRCCGYDPLNFFDGQAEEYKKARLQDLRDSLGAVPKNWADVPAAQQHLHHARPVMLHAESFSHAKGALKRFLPPNSSVTYILGGVLAPDAAMFSHHLQQVMACMESGTIAVLVNVPYLYEALMALFNGCFVNSGGRFLSRITLDGQSVYCPVGDGFRAIVVTLVGIPATLPIENSAAFADRFQRHAVLSDINAAFKWEKFDELVKTIPATHQWAFRLTLGNKHAPRKDVLFGYHPLMLRELWGIHGVGEVLRTAVLRLINIPAFMSTLLGSCCDVRKAFAACEYVYEARKLETLLCSMPSTKNLCVLLPIAKPNAVETSLEDLRHAVKHSAGDKRVAGEWLDDAVWVGPYTSDTLDGLLHIELEQLPAVKQRIAIVLSVDPRRMSNVLSYHLYALCEVIVRMSLPSTEVLLLVVLPAASPSLQLDIHSRWTICVQDTLERPATVGSRYNDYARMTIERAIKDNKTLLSDETGGTMRSLFEAHRSGKILQAIADRFDAQGWEMTRALLSRGTVSFSSFHQIKALLDAARSAVMTYCAIASVHVTNLAGGWVGKGDHFSIVRDGLVQSCCDAFAAMDRSFLPPAVRVDNKGICPFGTDMTEDMQRTVLPKLVECYHNTFVVDALAARVSLVVASDPPSLVVAAKQPTPELCLQCIHFYVTINRGPAHWASEDRQRFANFLAKPQLYDLSLHVQQRRDCVFISPLEPHCPAWLWSLFVHFRKLSYEAVESVAEWVRTDPASERAGSLAQTVVQNVAPAGDGKRFVDFAVFVLRFFPHLLGLVLQHKRDLDDTLADDLMQARNCSPSAAGSRTAIVAAMRSVVAASSVMISHDLLCLCTAVYHAERFLTKAFSPFLLHRLVLSDMPQLVQQALAKLQMRQGETAALHSRSLAVEEVWPAMKQALTRVAGDYNTLIVTFFRTTLGAWFTEHDAPDSDFFVTPPRLEGQALPSLRFEGPPTITQWTRLLSLEEVQEAISLCECISDANLQEDVARSCARDLSLGLCTYTVRELEIVPLVDFTLEIPLEEDIDISFFPLSLREPCPTALVATVVGDAAVRVGLRRWAAAITRTALYRIATDTDRKALPAMPFADGVMSQVGDTTLVARVAAIRGLKAMYVYHVLRAVFSANVDAPAWMEELIRDEAV